MAILNLQISSLRDRATLVSTFQTPGGNQTIANRLASYIQSVSTGTESAMSSTVPPQIAISVVENTPQASQLIGITTVNTSGDTMIINGVTFTANAVAGANQWAIGGTGFTSAAGLAAAVNASVSPLILGYVTASVSGLVVTLTAVVPGIGGNTNTVAKGVDAGNVMTVSGPRFVGGAADPSALTLSF